MSKGASKTGIGPTVVIAIEQFFSKEKRIVNDDIAIKILPFNLKLFTYLMKIKFVRNWMINKSENFAPGIWGGMLCRKKYIDENLESVSGSIESIVNLGAGFDTRAFRLESIKHINVWEIDQANNIKTKQKILSKIFGEIPSNLKLVSIDFDKEQIETTLASNNYSLNSKTFFILEGVTQYLTEEAIQSTFNFLSKAKSGSKLVFTYIIKEFLDGKNLYGWERGYNIYVLKNKLWLFGIHPHECPEYLNKFGWKLIEDLSASDLKRKYIDKTGRNLSSIPIERIILAEKL